MRISDWRSDGFSSDRDLVGRNPSVTDELIVRRERTGELGRDLEIYASANGVAARPHQVVAGDHVSNIAVRRLRLDRKARRHRITERSRHGRLPFDPVVIAIGADERGMQVLRRLARGDVDRAADDILAEQRAPRSAPTPDAPAAEQQGFPTFGTWKRG